MKLFDIKKDPDDFRLILKICENKMKEITDKLDKEIEINSKTINGMKYVQSNELRMRIKALRALYLKELQAMQKNGA